MATSGERLKKKSSRPDRRREHCREVGVVWLAIKAAICGCLRWSREDRLWIKGLRACLAPLLP